MGRQGRFLKFQISSFKSQDSDSGLWALGSGLWTLDSGLWTLDSGLWTLYESPMQMPMARAAWTTSPSGSTKRSLLTASSMVTESTW